jgi:hypothetical protein
MCPYSCRMPAAYSSYRCGDVLRMRRSASLAGLGLGVVDRVVEPRRQPDRVGVVGGVGQLVDGLQDLGQVPLVVIVPLLLCVASQQVFAQWLRVRQQAIPLVAQVHGWESRTPREPVPTDPGFPDRVVAKAISARHLAASTGAPGTGFQR